jgi:TM2 domain-containing membrane protein YozV
MTQKRRSGFLFFIATLIPGAGEMYMGFMRQGLSLMIIFFLSIFFTTFSNGLLSIALPVVWLYSFFHAHNLKGLSDEEFYAVEDNYIFEKELGLKKGLKLDKKVRKVAGIFLIFMGLAFVYHRLLDLIMSFLPESYRYAFWDFANYLPQAIIAIALILIGIRLIRGKKKELDQEEAGRIEMQDRNGGNYEN